MNVSVVISHLGLRSFSGGVAWPWVGLNPFFCLPFVILPWSGSFWKYPLPTPSPEHQGLLLSENHKRSKKSQQRKHIHTPFPRSVKDAGLGRMGYAVDVHRWKEDLGFQKEFYKTFFFFCHFGFLTYCASILFWKILDIKLILLS